MKVYVIFEFVQYNSWKTSRTIKALLGRSVTTKV